MTIQPSFRNHPGSPGSKNGLFFVFEGIDGAGKTTQAFLLKKRLEGAGFRVLYVKEPTEGRWGRKIRRIALEGRDHVTPEEELEYFILDRQEDIENNIAPALARNEIVIADRYYYSTIAYQSVLGLDPDHIRRKNASFPVPDRVLLIEVPVPVGQVRITEHRGQETNTGYEQVSFLESVKTVFDQMDDPNMVRIDGRPPTETVAEAVWRTVWPLVKDRLG